MSLAVDYHRSPELTQRELEALALAAMGKKTHEAGQIMCVAPCTIKKYHDSARIKLHANTIAHAVSIAWAKGLFVARQLVVAALIICSAASPSLLLNDDMQRIVRNNRTARTLRVARNSRTQRFGDCGTAPDLEDLNTWSPA